MDSTVSFTHMALRRFMANECFPAMMKFTHIVTKLYSFCRNVYKRLKFLGNREISQLAALLFLAVWHGLHTGYYMCFFMEFLVMNAEKKVCVHIKNGS